MNALPEPFKACIWLIVTLSFTPPRLIDMVASLSLRRAVRVIDGGNHFNAYRCSRSLARLLGPGGTAGLNRALGRISIARAFTCYQMLTLLNETPAVPQPTFALDLLTTFFDESVSLTESRRLLETCTRRLQRLSLEGPVVVSAGSPPPGPRSEFLDILAAAAEQVWIMETPPPPPLWPTLPL
jgi:hypothetical protein